MFTQHTLYPRSHLLSSSFHHFYRYLILWGQIGHCCKYECVMLNDFYAFSPKCSSLLSHLTAILCSAQAENIDRQEKVLSVMGINRFCFLWYLAASSNLTLFLVIVLIWDCDIITYSILVCIISRNFSVIDCCYIPYKMAQLVTFFTAL